MKAKIILIVALPIILTTLVNSSFADADAGEVVAWKVISSGGTINAQSDSYKASSVIGQTASGKGMSDNYKILHGYLQDFSGGSGIVVNCGDVNEDEAINIKDITYLIKYKYKGGSAPIPEECVGDVNNDDSVNIKDITDLIKYKYKGGSAPDEDCCNPVW
jgi:hypothetical protein